MDMQYWLDFLLSFSLGLVLILFSHGKLPGSAQLHLKVSRSFLVIIKYIGWFSLLYSCYGLWIDMVLRGKI